ncbi:uncharacterized protein LOC110119237 [Bombus terrestris]|uniref:Uncharacterized protein LOC110119237 n=1 Tax=Bombus terrestris TaxID=30195 RepID=A0A9C6SFK0_BOMTE|nr:uncharacterized protein LOC110119237 [Bombus terrestris]XP_048261278.1 uncharacterized protein LOC110119237 [Bombus terrestris]XP_048261279.1 uncharacterized protein LOC110119237 [Bombus terrestris]
MKMPGFMVGPKDYRGYAVRICHLASGLRPGTSQLQLLRLLWECSNSGSEAKNFLSDVSLPDNIGWDSAAIRWRNASVPLLLTGGEPPVTSCARFEQVSSLYGTCEYNKKTIARNLWHKRTTWFRGYTPRAKHAIKGQRIILG